MCWICRNALEATKITKLELLNSLWADMLQQYV